MKPIRPLTLENSTLTLDSIISGYVWKLYLKSLGSPKRHFVNKNNYIFDFDEDLLNFSHKTEISEEDFVANLLDSVCLDDSDEVTDSYVSADSDVGTHWQVFSKKFINDKDTETRSAISVDRALPVTMGIELNSFALGKSSTIELCLPQELSFSDLAGTSVALTSSRKQNFVKITNWRRNLDISVKPGHSAEVTCVLHQNDVTVQFTVTSTVSLSKNCLPVFVRRQSDNKIIYTCIITSLVEICIPHIGQTVSATDSHGVMMTSRGRCRISSWGNEDFVITSEPYGDLRETFV